MSIHELWGHGPDLNAVHKAVKASTQHLWSLYKTCSFKFTIDSYQGSRSAEDKVRIINSFAYLGFEGPIRMRGADEEFVLHEDWPYNATPLGIPDPKHYYFGRHLANGARDLPKRLDLKKRRYISTTSMDAELALVTANMALAAPGKIMYDPFVGTGSFPIACAQFGALTFGSDIDGRSIRGDEKKRTLKANFEQYGLLAGLGGMFTADLTNSPIRRTELRYDGDGVTGRLFDGIVCDPPYGVREGLRVLGVRDPEKSPWVEKKGREMYKWVIGRIPEVCASQLTELCCAGIRTLFLPRSPIASSTCWTTYYNSQPRLWSTMGGCRFGCRRPMMRIKKFPCQHIPTLRLSQSARKRSTNVCFA